MDVQRVVAKAQAVRAAVAEELMAVETAAVRRATAVSGGGWSVTRVVAATLSTGGVAVATGSSSGASGGEPGGEGVELPRAASG
jgi:hypothetical protein